MCDKSLELTITLDKWTNPDLSDQKEPEARNHKSLIYLQKELHLKKMRLMKPPEPVEKLYRLEATRRQVMQLVQQNSDKKHANDSKFSFRPSLDPNSQKIVERLETDVVDRVYNWQEQKEERLKKLTENIRQNEEEQISQKTQQYRFVNNNLQAESKVKLLLESMDYQKTKLNGKQLYHSNTFAPKRDQGADFNQDFDRGFSGPLDVHTKDEQRVLYQSVPCFKYEDEGQEKAADELGGLGGGSFKKKNWMLKKKGNRDEFVEIGGDGRNLIMSLLREV